MSDETPLDQDAQPVQPSPETPGSYPEAISIKEIDKNAEEPVKDTDPVDFDTGNMEACYCGESKEERTFSCMECKVDFHQCCILLLKNWPIQPLEGDPYYTFFCHRCGGEELKRFQLNWEDVVQIAIHNLLKQEEFVHLIDGKRYCRYKDIWEFVDNHWVLFWSKPRTANWKTFVSSALSSDERFISATLFNEQAWALDTEQLDWIKKPCVVGSLIATDGTLIDLDELKPIQRKRKKYEDFSQSFIGEPKRRTFAFADELDPSNSIMLYPDLDNVNDEPVRMSDFPTHTAPQVNILSDGLTVINEKGYRMAKATHGVWEGHWYYEVTLNGTCGHARIGWSQISGDLQAPCGFDQFSYGFRDHPGTLFHQARSVSGPTGYVHGYDKADVLGVAINIPKKKNRKEGVDPMLLKRLWDPDVMEAYMPFRHPPLQTIPKSTIEYYKNGSSLGAAFQNLYQGKYHPAISLFKGASVTVNFGPDFIFPPPEGALPFCEIRNVPNWEECKIAYTALMEDERERKRQQKMDRKSKTDGSDKVDGSTDSTRDEDSVMSQDIDRAMQSLNSPMNLNNLIQVQEDVIPISMDINIMEASN